MEWVAASTAAIVTIITGFFGWMKLRDSTRFKGIKELLHSAQAQLIESREQIRVLREELRTAHAGQVNWDKERNTLIAEVNGLRFAVARLEIGITAAILVVNVEGDIVDVNPMVTELTGWAKDELMGKDLRVLVPFRLRHRHWKGFTGAVAGAVAGKPLPEIPIDTFVLTRTGSEVPVRISLSEWKDDEGKRMFSAELRRRAV